MKEYIDVLGRVCRDKVTGFEGVAASVSLDLYGCVQVALTPEVGSKSEKADSNGKWFDFKRLTVSKKRKMPAPSFDTPEEHTRQVAAPKRAGDENGPAAKPHRSF